MTSFRRDRVRARDTCTCTSTIFFCHAADGVAFPLAMVDFMLAGGWMMIVITAVAIPLLVTAAKFSRNASPHGLSLVRALTTAVVFAAIAGVVVALAKVARMVVMVPELRKDLVDNLLMGFNEAMAPAVLGFTIVTLAWILVAFGVRRMPKE